MIVQNRQCDYCIKAINEMEGAFFITNITYADGINVDNRKDLDFCDAECAGHYINAMQMMEHKA